VRADLLATTALLRCGAGHRHARPLPLLRPAHASGGRSVTALQHKPHPSQCGDRPDRARCMPGVRIGALAVRRGRCRHRCAGADRPHRHVGEGVEIGSGTRLAPRVARCRAAGSARAASCTVAR
jgi:hypothetical protein